MNAVVLRWTSKEMLGVVNVRLVLLYTSVQFFSREPLRKAGLSLNREQRHDLVTWRCLFNLVWLAVPAGLFFAVSLAWVWNHLLERPPATVGDYTTAVAIYAGCAVLELLAEPLWVTAQILLMVKLKVVAEGLALAVRCGLTLVLLVGCPQWGLYCFCLSQVAYSITIVFVYYWAFGRHLWQRTYPDWPVTSLRQLLPAAHLGHRWWFWSTSPDLSMLARGFFWQSLLKQLLTEGERYLMTFFSLLTFEQQGTYDTINNLGSLVARFLFLPIEENFYTFFAGLLSRGSVNTSQKHHRLVAKTLQTLLKFMLLVGLTILVFGQAYAALALDIYGGHTLSQGDGPLLLRAFCVYLVFLAVNGISECFLFAVSGCTLHGGTNPN